MAKKVKVSSAAELEGIVNEDISAADGSDKETAMAQKLDAAKKDESDPIITITLPRLHSGKPVTIQINNKSYHGQVTCKESLARQLIEMADKIVDREADVHVGKKYTGNGNGARGMRYAGNL